MITSIQSVLAREILDSRGNPTVEVQLSDGNSFVRAAVPSGASTGIHEALELRDNDSHRYRGKGVLQAVENVKTILGPSIIGMDPNDQETLDAKLLEIDGTEKKEKYGANALLGISLAAARLAAKQQNIPLFRHLQNLFGGKISLPRPMMNIINGGKHADSGLAIQEFMIFPRRGSFSENLRSGAEIFHALKKILTIRGESVGVGDEGGFAPRLQKCSDAFDVILEAVEKAGYTGKIDIAIDAAASEFYQDGEYLIDGKKLSSEELVDFYADLLKKYPLVSIEDSHSEDDFEGFALMQERFGNTIQLVGDDLLVTNKKRLQIAIDKKLCNSILIKVNQIGTLSETFQTLKLAKKNNFGTVISHRSGETEDTFIADLSVGVDAGQIKTGSLCRSERVAKYNQLLRIGEQI
ncbi:phosphopyruvate hydratase [Candidatus Gracilibacteria bacterium]|nr:phosphopyruvate hydratase [Candidatus Gracilibacteria bacterium]MCF7819799.1 phosphopyruvate hydratase [Candidatus Gracilibacteria bacterium]